MARDPSAPAALRVLDSAVTLAGDPESSLEGINTYELPDGALVYSIENQVLYRFNRSSTATADGDRIVAPTAGPGRWDKTPNPSLQKGQMVLSFGPLTADQQETASGTLAGAKVGDVVALSPAVDLGADAAIAWSRVSAADTLSVRIANVGSGTVAAATVTFDTALIGSIV